MVDTYTIVAFRYNRKRSVLYRNSELIPDICDLVLTALAELDADVISIRRVRVK